MGGNTGAPRPGLLTPKGDPEAVAPEPPRPRRSTRKPEEAASCQGRELARAGGTSRRDGDGPALGLGTPGNPARLPPGTPPGSPRAPPGGGAGVAEAQSRRFPAEGQQQLRSAAGEGGTRPSPTAQAPAPTRAPPPPRYARRPPRSASAAERRERASRGGQPQPPSREMPQPRLLSRRPGSAASAAGTHLRLRRPGRPGRAPGRCVRLRPRERSPRRLVRAAEAPSSAQSGGGSESSQHPGPRTRNYFPTRFPLPPPPLPPPPAATSQRHRPGGGGGGVTAPPRSWRRRRAGSLRWDK